MIKNNIYYFILLFIPLGILAREFGIGAGGYFLFFGFGYVCGYYIRELNYSYPGDTPALVRIQMMLLSLTSIILLTKYFWISYGDYPGLFILPFFFLMTCYSLIKYSLKYIKLSITSILFIIISIPVIHTNTLINVRGYIPLNWYNPNIIKHKFFKEIISEFKTSQAEILTRDAIELRNYGFSGEAHMKLKKAQALEPNNARIKFEISSIYSGAKDFRNAIKYLEKAIDLDPSEVIFYNNIGLYSYKLGDHIKALTYLEKGLELDSTFLLIHHNLVLVLVELENYEKDCYHFDKCLQAHWDIDEEIMQKIKNEHCN